MAKSFDEPLEPWEQKCSFCGGCGQNAYGDCHYCKGTGVETTEQGRNLLKFLKNNLVVGFKEDER